MSGDPFRDHVTPYDRFAWSDEEVEEMLARGDHERELVAFFGASEYRVIDQLARAARAAPAGGERIWIVPGMMGTQLGLQRRDGAPNDLLWLDPVDIAAGRLTLLKLPGAAHVVQLGAVLHSSLRMKLRLRAAGFDPVIFSYDWRLGIADAAKRLARQLRADPARTIHLVAHSMGGLVCRAALAHAGLERVRRVVMLGTPCAGSFAPVQGLRGTYAVVRKIARIDGHHSAEWLTREVFRTFPGLYEMLPAALDDRDWFDAQAWPQSDLTPDAELLARARHAVRTLPPPDARLRAIAGTGCETVTAAYRAAQELEYTVTLDGDGTVPADSAAAGGVPAWYANVAHSELMRDADLARAVVALLHDASPALPATRGTHRAVSARVSDGELRLTHLGKVSWARLDPEDRRVYLETLNDPPRFGLQAVAHGATAPPGTIRPSDPSPASGAPLPPGMPPPEAPPRA